VKLQADAETKKI